MKFTAAQRYTACLLLSAAASPALAQNSVLISPTPPEGFSSDRNVAVTERPRPDYTPNKVRVGAFVVAPRLAFNLGFTDNVDVIATQKRSDAFVVIRPSVDISSDWSTHLVYASANVEATRYSKISERNKTPYAIQAGGRLDVSPDIEIGLNGLLERQFENPLSGELDATIADLSSYQHASIGPKLTYRAGRFRTIVALDYSTFAFNNFSTNGVAVDQTFRDRNLARGSVQLEYALTPSFSVYGQGSYDSSSYKLEILPSGIPNVDSKSGRLIGGVSFDLAGTMRGTIGAGYVVRNFSSSLYDAVKGLSVEANLQWFPSDLTTVSLTLRRLLADSSVGSANAFFDNRVTVRVDHELLTNLLLNAQAEMAFINYEGLDRNFTNYRLGAGANYLVNRNISLNTNLAYAGRSGDTIGSISSYKRFEALFGVVLQR